MSKILLIEDDPVLQKLYTDLLILAQHTVDTASDADEAFAKMSKGGWDLIFLDFFLPKMTGLDLVKKLSLTPLQEPNKKIVFLTNLEKGPEIEEIQTLGYDYIIKSNMTPDQFIEKVRTLLNSS